LDGNNDQRGEKEEAESLESTSLSAKASRYIVYQEKAIPH
jgi:hypothetical protein